MYMQENIDKIVLLYIAKIVNKQGCFEPRNFLMVPSGLHTLQIKGMYWYMSTKLHLITHTVQINAESYSHQSKKLA